MGSLCVKEYEDGEGRRVSQWDGVVDYDTPPKVAPHASQEYRGNGKHVWEHVVSVTWRLRVPGGWLYTEADRGSTTFVPMPEVVKYKV